MIGHAVFAWEQLCLSQVFDVTALHAFLDELGIIPPHFQFRLSATFAIPSQRILRSSSGAVRDLSNGPVVITRSNRFCTAMQMGMTLRVTKGLAAERAARERVPVLEKPIMAALLSLDRVWMQ